MPNFTVATVIFMNFSLSMKKRALASIKRQSLITPSTRFITSLCTSESGTSGLPPTGDVVQLPVIFSVFTHGVSRVIGWCILGRWVSPSVFCPYPGLLTRMADLPRRLHLPVDYDDPSAGLSRHLGPASLDHARQNGSTLRRRSPRDPYWATRAHQD